MRLAFVVPAYENGRSVGALVAALRLAARELPSTTEPSVIVVDDGSSDDTGEAAGLAGGLVLRHAHNQGKGRALRTGFLRARELGATAVVTVDADGQHPASEALALARHPTQEPSLVLGVRDLVRDGAPAANRFSNAFSNRWMSWFCRRALHDTQCGLRRYPLSETLALSLRGSGYDFEAEVILKAVRTGITLVEVPVRVVYPPAAERVSHFDALRDPARIVLRILHTVGTTRWRKRAQAQ